MWLLAQLEEACKPKMANGVDTHVRPKSSRHEHGLQPEPGSKVSRPSMFKAGRHMCFDLPALSEDYERDRSDKTEDTGFGNGLKRYIHRRTKTPRAVLRIAKSHLMRFSVEGLARHLELICTVDHPNVVALVDCCEDERFLLLVYEWCDGGLFMHQITRQKDNLRESHVAKMVHDALSGLAAAHALGVAHADLGLFSFFCAHRGDVSQTKVFGIGLAGCVVQDLFSRTKRSRTNKHFYAAWDLFEQPFSRLTPPQQAACDIRAMGALVYTLGCGRPPFGVGSRAALGEKIKKNEWQFGIEFDAYSSTLREFIEKLMAKDRHKRPTAQDALRHTWLATATSATNGACPKDRRRDAKSVRKLCTFAKEDRARQTLARMLVDLGPSSTACQRLGEEFKRLDLNGDGTLTPQELAKFAGSITGFTAGDVQRVVQALDRNGNQRIDAKEFMTALIMQQDTMDGALVRTAFQQLDKNGDARVTRSELKHVFGKYSEAILEEDVDVFLHSNDRDGDECMDFREFTNLFGQVNDDHQEIQQRLAVIRAEIGGAPTYLESFRASLAKWMHEIDAFRSRLEIAVDLKNPPRKAERYSYASRHFSEFEVHDWIRDVIRLLARPPGYVLSRPQRLYRQRQREQTRASKGDHVMLGMTILAAEKRARESKQSSRRRGSREGGRLGPQHGSPRSSKSPRSPTGRGGSCSSPEGSDVESRFRSSGTEDATRRWLECMERSMEVRLADPQWLPESKYHDMLWFLVKTKADCRWIPELVGIIDVLKDVCVDNLLVVRLNCKEDLDTFKADLDSSCVIQTRVTIKEGGPDKKDIILPTNARTLAMGSFRGRNLAAPAFLERTAWKYPMTVMLAVAKSQYPVITEELRQRMRDEHLRRLTEAAKLLARVLHEIDALCAEVTEDLTIANSLEDALPSVPRSSDLFLRHCEGRGPTNLCKSTKDSDAAWSDADSGSDAGSEAESDEKAPGVLQPLGAELRETHKGRRINLNVALNRHKRAHGSF